MCVCVCACVWSTTLFKGSGTELWDVTFLIEQKILKKYKQSQTIEKTWYYQVFYFYAFHRHANNKAESILI